MRQKSGYVIGLLKLRGIRYIEIVCIAGLLFAYLSHLGYLPLNIEEDEARRILVTQEMIVSGDYVTPTINGEIYLNKPPLYNWILAGYFGLFGNYSMFTFRLQVVVAIFLTGLLIYYFTKKYTSRSVAFFTAFAFMTNGRLLIYDSLYGFIDLTFTLVVYTNLMLTFFFGEKGSYYRLFILTYLACSIGFLLKGLPAIAFQLITLVTFFALQKKIKKLFSIQHLTGLFTFIIVTGSYYLVYFLRNKFSLSKVFDILFYESSKRTFLEYPVLSSVKHFFSFPFEMLYHFLPWTIFLLVLLNKKSLVIIRQNTFTKYILWAFLANIIIYWVSVDVYPKYIFMLLPLVYCILFYSWFHNPELAGSWQQKTISIIICIISIAMFVCSLALPFSGLINKTSYPYAKAAALVTGFGLCCYMVLKNKYRLHFFLLSLILLRTGFNLFVIEQRGERFAQAEAWSRQIVEISKGKPLFILENTNTGNFDGYSFYISNMRQEILRKTNNVLPGAFYITDETGLKNKHCIADLHFLNFPDRNSLYLVHCTPVLK